MKAVAAAYRREGGGASKADVATATGSSSARKGSASKQLFKLDELDGAEKTVGQPPAGPSSETELDEHRKLTPQQMRQKWLDSKFNLT